MRISDWSSDVCSSDLFKLSNDPQFVEKLRDVVGLYVDPPAHAVGLSVDEKSQIQALDRTQPGLPMKKGRAGTMTHDYKRHGTTTLFAALNVLDGMVIAQKMQQPPPRKGNSRTSAFASSMAAWPPFMSLESIRQWHKEPDRKSVV